MATYESIYPGASYLLEPNYNFSGYRTAAGDMGGTTSIRTANQLGEVSKLLNTGMKTTEISLIQPDTFESMPQDHLKEIYRLNKLTGAESTMHAPIIDPSGFGERGGWNESQREVVEQQFKNFVKRSQQLNPNGNVPVTIHASANIPGSEHIPKGKDGEELGKMIAVDQESGQLIPLEKDVRFYPSETEGKSYTPQDELKQQNSAYWDQQISQAAFSKDRGDEILTKFYPLIAGEKPENFSSEQKIAAENVELGRIFLNNTHKSLNSTFNNAFKFSDNDGKEALKKLSKEYTKEFDKYRENPMNVGALSGAIQTLMTGMAQITEIKPPEKFVQIEQFATDKASETISNVALNSYKEFKDKSPIISIENPPYGSAISSGEDLKNLIVKSREKFANNLVKQQGISKQEAEKAAEKLIGATWDTSHISMIRKQGFDNKKLIEEAKTIAPFVKHVHYNDNFGTTHTDVPPGMGDTPMKAVMEEIEKRGFKGKKIFEGGNFAQHFGPKHIFPFQLEYSGSPLYSTGETPYWNQLGMMGGYYSGHGPINPAVHHQTYGSGFHNLPMELGGNIPGGQQSRFSGTPNA